MKGENTRGYPYQGYPPAAGCNWLRVDFDEGGVPGEKPPESDWDWLKLSPHKTLGPRVEPMSQRWKAWLITTKPSWLPPLSHPDSPHWAILTPPTEPSWLPLLSHPGSPHWAILTPPTEPSWLPPLSHPDSPSPKTLGYSNSNAMWFHLNMHAFSRRGFPNGQPNLWV